MLLLIDGSALLNSQYFGNMPDSVQIAKGNIKKAKTEEEKLKAIESLNNSYKDLLQTSDGTYTNAVYGFMKYLFKIIKTQKPEYLAVTWDVTRDTFRRELSSDYKGTRPQVDEPLKQQFKTCQKMLKDMGIAQFFSTKYESDDYCGSIVKKFENYVEINILTKDHDFFQLVSENTNIWLLCHTAKIAKELNLKHKIDSKLIPDKTFLVNKNTLLDEYGFNAKDVPIIKALAGDTSDNIHGVNGIGEQTAIALSKKYDSIDDLFNDVENKSKKELEELKETWKIELGLKRSPIKYLLEEKSYTFEDGTTKTAKEMADLSYKLAKIKTDIDLDIDLNDLKYKTENNIILDVLEKYEIKSIKL